MIRSLPCPHYAPAEVKAVWNSWTLSMQEAWIAHNRLKPKNKLQRPKEFAVVAQDVFCHDATVLTSVREALAMGLRPTIFALIGDSVVLRLEREES